MNPRKKKFLIVILAGVAVIQVAAITAVVLLSPWKYDGRTVAEWAEELESPDPAVRSRTVTRLAAGGADAVPLLIAILEPPGSVEILLGRDVPDVDGLLRRREGVTAAVAAMGADAVPPLVRIAREDDPGPRRNALDLLAAAGAGSELAREALIEALKDEDAGLDIRVAAAVSLWRLTQNADGLHAVLVEDLLRSEGAKAAWVLEEMGEAAAPAIDGIVRAFSHEQASTRLSAARILGGLGPTSAAAIPAFEHVLAESDESDAGRAIRGAAALALVRLDPDNVAGREHLFRRVFEDGSRKAAVLLWTTGRERERLLKILLWPRGTEAPLLPHVIEDFGPSSAEAVPFLLRTIMRPEAGAGSTATTLAAILSLGLIGPPAGDAVPRLTELTQGEDPVPVPSAAVAVFRISGAWEEPLRILAAIASGDVESGVTEQVTAVIGLATMAATVPGAADQVVRATKHENPIVRGIASAALRRMGR